MAEPGRCARCGAILTKDEAALTKKLINRGTTRYYCMDCLAKYFEVPVKNLYDKLEEFREAGCTLFAPKAK